MLQKVIIAIWKESIEQNKRDLCGSVGSHHKFDFLEYPISTRDLPPPHSWPTYTMQHMSVVRYKQNASQQGWVTAPDPTVGKREICVLSNILSDPTTSQLSGPTSVASCQAHLGPLGWLQDGMLQMFYWTQAFLGHSRFQGQNMVHHRSHILGNCSL